MTDRGWLLPLLGSNLRSSKSQNCHMRTFNPAIAVACFSKQIKIAHDGPVANRRAATMVSQAAEAIMAARGNGSSIFNLKGRETTTEALDKEEQILSALAAAQETPWDWPNGMPYFHRVD
jgi:glutamine phosphoribosylpyrophosphate amidotransferase